MSEQATYRHTQPGRLLQVCLYVPALALFLACMFVIAIPTPALFGLFAAGVVLFVAGWLFGSLTVIVGSRPVGTVEIRFGPGLIRKRWALDDFTSVAVARNKWYYGWGIHLIPKGWLYNVSGLDAVELVRKNGRALRIGTDEPAALDQALRAALKLS
jgi:hypothetical protein